MRWPNAQRSLRSFGASCGNKHMSLRSRTLFEETANDGLTFADIEAAVANGQINRTFSDDPRGDRYEVIGAATDNRVIAVICRIKETGKLLFITTWEIYES